MSKSPTIIHKPLVFGYAYIGDIMITTIIRTVILYFFLMLVMRIMGKRQIGQLQPVELVITILISEISALPMQDSDIPLVNSVVAVLMLASLEILISAVSMKSIKLRSLMQGNSLVIIRNGVLDQKQIKRLRFTVDDILEALRKKDVFDISDVQFAIAETDGTLSVLLKPEKRNVTNEDMNLPGDNTSLPCVLISDGRVIKADFADCNITEKKLFEMLKAKKIKAGQILLMTLDDNGNVNIIEKERDL